MEPGFPVWSIRPNWREGVLERLEWLTDVMVSSVGAEQRRALRLSPRRYIEITVNPTKNERSFLDLTLHNMGSDDWLFPLWWDQGKLVADVEAGDARVEFDNTYREFLTGGVALIYKDTFTWEVISIVGQDDEGLDLDVVLDSDWPEGTKVYPLRLARLPVDTSLSALTSTVGESVLMFQVIQANDFVETIPDDMVFEGRPVLLSPPNRSTEITTDHLRLSSDRDNNTGLPYRVDPADRAFQVQAHSWTKNGRQAQAEFRAFLYWLRGRQRSLWLPSFNQDFVTARSSNLASTNLDIQKVGYTYAGGGQPIPGRDRVLINGVTPARITALGAPQAAGEERLRVGAGLTAAVASGVPGSFLSPARLNQDAVELMHHTDSDGALECGLTFQTFKDSRDASGTIYTPIPEGVELPYPCGDAITYVEIYLPLNPMPPVYDEYGVWFGNIRVGVTTQNYGSFSCQVNTTPRTNLVPDGYDEWAILGAPERVRYRYNPSTNSITLIVGDFLTDLFYYSIGNRTLSPWPGTAASLFPTVFVNGVEMEIRSIVTTSIPQLTDSATAYGTVTAFPVLDIDMRYWTV